MTEREKMIQILYKAASEGVAKLIKNGLAFTVMSGAIAGLLWGLLYLHDLHSQEMTAFKADVRELRREHSAQLNEYRRLEVSLRMEIASCVSERMKDAERIARLEALVKNKFVHKKSITHE